MDGPVSVARCAVLELAREPPGRGGPDLRAVVASEDDLRGAAALQVEGEPLRATALALLVEGEGKGGRKGLRKGGVGETHPERRGNGCQYERLDVSEGKVVQSVRLEIGNCRRQRCGGDNVLSGRSESRDANRIIDEGAGRRGTVDEARGNSLARLDGGATRSDVVAVFRSATRRRTGGRGDGKVGRARVEVHVEGLGL